MPGIPSVPFQQRHTHQTCTGNGKAALDNIGGGHFITRQTK